MIETALLVFAGALVGWNFPQPFWAVWVQNKIKETWNKITNKTDSNTPEE